MRPRQTFVALALLTASVGWGGCSGAHEQNSSKVAARPGRHFAGPVVDVSAFLGLSIDELYQRVGPPKPLPAGFVDPVTLPLKQRGIYTDSAALLQLGPLNMVVTFDINTHQVSDFILLGSDEEQIMYQGNLKLNSEKYLVMPVFEMGRPRQLLGLRVVSKKM
ncbi:hypothetical protein GCM10023185_17460 [Hymenobacter saemangeumensis]|uniref:Uncharacterized protein n=1 Tax=Hymenobacter saemangeumensis TaxID=1084522 RepID=A0ABP8IBB7_9BACT